MKKSDLKTGMTIETRNKQLFRVLKDVETEAYGHQEYVFARLKETGFLIGDNYTEDLFVKDKNNAEYDIVLVYGSLKTTNLISTQIGIPIWEQPTYELVIPNESTTNQHFPETEKILKKQKEKEYRTIIQNNILKPSKKNTIIEFVNHGLQFEIYKKIPGKNKEEKANSIAQLILEKWGD